MIPIVLKVYDGGKLTSSRAFKAERICLGSAEARGRTYELGGPTTYSFKELLQLILKETGRRCALVRARSRAPR